MRRYGRIRVYTGLKTLLQAAVIIFISSHFGLANAAHGARNHRAAGIMDDLADVQLCHKGLAAVLQFMRSRPDLFPEARLRKKRMVSTEQKIIVRSTWQSFLDYCLALDALQQQHKNFHSMKPKHMRRDSFLVLYTAFLAQYRYALEFLRLADNDPAFDVVFNESDTALGLPGWTYAAFKYRFLNVGIATEFAALNTVNTYYARGYSVPVPLSVAEDRAFVWAMGKGAGEALTLKNAVQIVRRAGFSVWLPVQQGIAEFMGDTRVWREGSALISRAQIQEMLPRLKPGDILFERREWYLSNIGLPGFWTHAALFVGTPAERELFFADDADVCAWLSGRGIDACDFEKLLCEKHSGAYARSIALQEEGLLLRVIEAIGEGVSFTTLEHSASCDSLAVLRPRLSKREKARAIERAFSYWGRPYDFNFDFLTDAELVCSELVYKCYEPAEGYTGLDLPLVDMLGRKLTPPNDIVRQFDQNYGTAQQQADLVLFYDGIEFQKKAQESSLDEFRKSWTRPRWHVFMQKTRDGEILSAEQATVEMR
jgi:hypothetical protein